MVASGDSSARVCSSIVSTRVPVARLTIGLPQAEDQRGGTTPGAGKSLGLDEKWAYNAIKSVGNYGEIFEKHLGLSSPLKLERGYNNLWTKGGLIYAMPIR